MTNNFTNSRRDLRERAFQALFSLEFGGDVLSAAEFAYIYDKPMLDDEGVTVDIPVFLLSLVKGVQDFQADIDQQIEEQSDLDLIELLQLQLVV